MIIQQCKNKAELLQLYAERLQSDAKEHYGYGDREHTEPFDMFMETAKRSIKYAPHLYNGGWFIPGFGYSTERIDGQYVPNLTKKTQQAVIFLVSTY